VDHPCTGKTSTVAKGRSFSNITYRGPSFCCYQRDCTRGKSPRYYQEIAINRAIQAIATGNRRSLLTEQQPA
jgi:type I site-specific restriction endonuclease